MQSASSRNIDQHCYYGKRLGRVSLNKFNNFKKTKTSN